MQVREDFEERVVRYEVLDKSTRGESYLLDSQVAPCLHVTASTSHENLPHCGSGVQRALEACLRRNLQVRKTSSQKQGDANLHVCGQALWGIRLPLTVNGASGLSLCVNAFARCAHLQLPARSRGGVYSIGGVIRCRSGSGHGC